jgi:hypothetical protein
MKKSENMNGLSESEWETVRSLLSTISDDCKISGEHLDYALVRDIDLWRIHDGNEEDAAFAFTNEDDATKFITMVDVLARKMNASSLSERVWDGETGTESLPQNSLEVYDKPIDTPPLSLGFVGGYKYVEEREKMMNNLIEALGKDNVATATANSNSHTIWKSKHRYDKEQGFDLDLLTKSGYDTDSPTFQYLSTNNRHAATSALVISKKMDGLYEGGHRVRTIPFTFEDEIFEFTHTPSYATGIAPIGNDEKRAVKLRASSWETQADRGIGVIKIRTKWDGARAPYNAWRSFIEGKAGSTFHPMKGNGGWANLWKKWTKMTPYKEYEKEINNLIRRTVKAVDAVRSMDLEYTVSLHDSYMSSHRVNITNILDETSDTLDIISRAFPNGYSAGREEEYWFYDTLPVPNVRIVVSLREKPDTQAHRVIPMLPKMLNELTLYREALSEITKALRMPYQLDAIESIQSIIAPFDYAEMGGEEE